MYLFPNISFLIMSILFPNMFESLICNISQRLLEEKSQGIWIIKVKLFFSWIDECNAIMRASWTKISNLYIYIYTYISNGYMFG